MKPMQWYIVDLFQGGLTLPKNLFVHLDSCFVVMPWKQKLQKL